MVLNKYRKNEKNTIFQRVKHTIVLFLFATKGTKENVFYNLTYINI